ncbi:UNVERIFIED_CONTAM: hypothetical protein Sradi_4417900 [Sesamum radiatum]|uniref:Uncharacterized protein n=1 Tax=Sesamum radiatum TaxID=300843 RepID=A0AAW2NTM8_SESRA
MATNEAGVVPGFGLSSTSGSNATHELEDLKIHTSDFPRLNDSFDAIRSLILVMDRITSVDKVYSLVLRIERQRQGSVTIEEINNNAAMMVRVLNIRKKLELRHFSKRKNWFNDLTEKRKKSAAVALSLECSVCSCIDTRTRGNKYSVPFCYDDWVTTDNERQGTSRANSAILTATYIVNRLPTSVFHWKTPYEVLFQEPVDYVLLRVFGVLLLPPMLCLISPSSLREHTDVFFLGLFPYKNVLAAETECLLPVPVLDEDLVITHIAPMHVSNSSTYHNAPPFSNVPSPVGSPALVLRISSRQISKPCWLNDFVCSTSHTSPGSPIVTSIAPSHSEVVASISILQEPRTYLQASTSPEWNAAMQAELDALESNKTRKLPLCLLESYTLAVDGCLS